MFRAFHPASMALALAALACATPAAAPVHVQEAEKAQATAIGGKKKALPSAKADEDGAIAKMDAFIAEKIKKGEIDKKADQWKTKMPFPPELEFDPKKDYFWHMRTNKGDIKIRFLSEVAPMHVSSSIYLIRTGFYDGLKFHRVIARFMAQGGCPLGKGFGGPGYKYTGEYDPKVKHNRPGLLSMANTGRPGTDGSQFFLTFAPTQHLNGKHTIFGEVVDGMEVVKALEGAASTSPNGVPPREPLSMISNTVTVETKKEAKAKGN